VPKGGKSFFLAEAIRRKGAGENGLRGIMVQFDEGNKTMS